MRTDASIAACNQARRAYTHAHLCRPELCKNYSCMPVSTEPVRILLVRPWTKPLASVRDALRDAGMTARISRVDIEPALNAALSRRSVFDVIIYDPTTTGISREMIEARLREHRRLIPIVTIGRLDELAAAIRRARAQWRN